MKLPAKPKRGSKNNIVGPGVIYARYSSHAQKDISIEQQVSLCRVLAAEYGIKIKEVYADRAMSGRTDKRPDFQRLLRDAEKGSFRYVISWKSSRIGRNMMEALINETRLNDFGVRILYVEEDFDDTAAGRFAARSMMNVNQFYSENMAEDVLRGMYSNAEKCLVTNGNLPFGYKANENLEYVIDKPKDEIVREIFTRVANGEPFVDIANDLNSRGIYTSHGNKWGKSSFYTLLHNERYLGTYIYGDFRKENGIPRIVSDELFNKVQGVLKMKKNPQGRHRVNGDYLLTGKLYCGECGSHMIGISGTGKSGALHYYYGCSQKRVKSGCCKKRNIQRDYIEKEVARGIKEYILRDDVIGWIADSVEKYQSEQRGNPEFQILKDRIAEINISIKNIMSAIEKGIFTDTTKERLQELEQERLESQRSLKMMESVCNELTRNDVISWVKSFNTGDIGDKKYQALLFDSFLTAVYLYDDGRVRIVFDVSGTDKTMDFSVINDDSECSESDESVRLRFGLGHQTRAKRTPEIRLVNRFFILTYWLKEKS